MHYHTTLAPLDDDGGFFHAIHFSAIKVGGEDTREIECARFETGNVADLLDVTDCLPACTMPRPPSRAEQDYMMQAAAGQAQLAQDGRQAPSLRAYYAQNAERMRHSAMLATENGLWLPRQILVSRSGRALIGIETGDLNWGGGIDGHLRLLDLRDRQLVLDETTSMRTSPPDLSGLSKDFFKRKGPVSDQDAEQLEAMAMQHLQRLSQLQERARDRHSLHPRQLSSPTAFSADGKRVLLGSEERLLVPGLPTTAKLASAGPAIKVLATEQGWLSLNDDNLTLFGYGNGKILARHPMPESVRVYAAVVCAAGKLLALPGEYGSVASVDISSGEIRRFRPHPGARSISAAEIAIAPGGSMFASVVDEKLCVTSLLDGVTVTVGKLSPTLRETSSHDDYLVRSVVSPAMAFIGGHLLVSDRDGLRIVNGEGAGRFVSEVGRIGARVPVTINCKEPVEKILAASLGQAAQHLLPHHSPALMMESRQLGKSAWLGASRLGGAPDLPYSVEWPMWRKRPMAFLAQINLADAQMAIDGLRLPRAGLLSFFLGCGQEIVDADGSRPSLPVDQMLGNEQGDSAGWRVIYTADTGGLMRAICNASPLPQTFTACSIGFTGTGMALPGESTCAYQQLPLDEHQRDDYHEVLAQLYPPAENEKAEHQLMGFPQAIQFTPPEWHCELASRGRDPNRIVPPDDPGYRKLMSGAADWGLLLQLASDGNADFMWGDGGHLYFYGKRKAMEQGDFSNVWIHFG